MQYFTRTLISAAVLLLSCNAYAKPSADVNCPCIPLVTANAKFVQAERSSHNETLWGMISNDFSYKGADWNVIFATTLPNATSSQEALEQGQAYFQQHVTLLNPESATTDDGQNICLYNKLSDGNGYLVAAINPPLHIPTAALSFVTRFKR